MGVVSNLDIQVYLKGRARLPTIKVVGRGLNSDDQDYGVLYRFWEEQLSRGLLESLISAMPDRLLDDTTIAVYGLKDQSLYRYLIGTMLASGVSSPRGFDALDLPATHYWHFVVRAPYWIEVEELWETVKARCSCKAVDDAQYGIELYNRHYIQSTDIRQIEFLMPAEMVS